MSRTEFLHWLHQQPMGSVWQWYEELDSQGTRICGIEDDFGNKVEGTSWDDVAESLMKNPEWCF